MDGGKRKDKAGLIGLAVMGQNLVLNMEEQGLPVAVYNRTWEKTEAFLEGPAAGKAVSGARSLEEFCARLERPRRILLMVKAGPAVDKVIEGLLPHLEEGDVILDGGNSHFEDTERRYRELKAKGLRFVGMGVSGGEEGARRGPSLMPGGDPEAWPVIRPLVEAIAARTEEGEPCTGWVGEGGAGHYVKMVHNGIEYGDMQIIAEAYDYLSRGMGLSAGEAASLFDRWNGGKLESYLIEITARTLAYREPGTDQFLVDRIRDAAGQKGTGRWTAVNALTAGEPVSLISEAVMARFLSARKEQREAAAEALGGPDGRIVGTAEEFFGDLEKAVYGAKLVSYAQGFQMLRRASRERGWMLDLGEVAQMWRGGCIIRSAFLGKIREAYRRNPQLEHLLLDSYFRREVSEAEEPWRRIAARGISAGLPLPAFTSALSYYDGLRSRRLPANLIQAQRDYFGAHTYERLDRPEGQFFHTDWTGSGGETASETYSA